MGITLNDLKICASLVREAKDMRGRMDALRSMMERSTPVLQQVPACGSGHRDKMAEGMIKLEAMEAECNRRIEAYLEHAFEVELCISMVSDANQRTILRLRYLDGLMWEEISDETHYNVRWCKELHTRALIELGLYTPRQHTKAL